MACKKFDNDDKVYQTWLRNHPEGFVVNTTRSESSGYRMLHRANCHSISQYTRMAKPGGYTERDYIKVCADTKEELKAWSSKRRCQICDP